MLLTILLSALAATPSPPASAVIDLNPKPAQATTCLRPEMRQAEIPGATPAPPAAKGNKLGELPPGVLQHTVARTVDGCLVPTPVRFGYGASTPNRR